MAVSVLCKDKLPEALMQTYLAQERVAFDGVFVLRKQQVDKIIADSRNVEQAVEQQKKQFERAFSQALAGDAAKGVSGRMQRWAADIVQRLRRRYTMTGAVEFEDVSSADYAESVNGARNGEWVQTTADHAAHVFISFGSLSLHFEGRASLTPASRAGPELLQLEMAPVITDTFDFHFKEEDEGTGWMDHAFARLQCSGDAKPFRIEGTGSASRMVITRAHAR